MNHAPTFTTERLRMRQLRLDDAEALHASYADVDAMTWWSHAPHTTLQETHDRLVRSLDGEDWRLWVITMAGDDTAIGSMAAHGKRQGGVIEIGYSLGRPHWGRGLAREAVAALIDNLFADGNRRVFADTDPDNDPSNALLRALGFTLEGRLRAEWDTHIGVRDSYIWGLLRDEWRARA